MLNRDRIAPRRHVVGVVAAALFLVAFAGSAFGQALDAPSLKVNRTGFFRIDLDVTAAATGAPNGFVIQWMKKSDFLALGWPATEYDPAAVVCDFTGDPSLNIDARSASFLLAPSGVIQVQMGDLFDETGIYSGDYLDALTPGEYAFRVWAEGNDALGVASSTPSQTIFAATSNPECTQGFWKNHPEAWPVGCTPMTLGTVSYTKTQLLANFGTPATGNGLISLAHQLITTKLNICNGSNPTNIAATVAAADAQIGGLVCPPVGSGFLSPGSTSGNTNTLDDYNNGIIPGVVNCATRTSQSTWGKVKSLYR
jgi:hypothetical protein